MDIRARAKFDDSEIEDITSEFDVTKDVENDKDLNDDEYFNYMMSRFSGEEFMRYLRLKGLKGNANYVLGFGVCIPNISIKQKQNFSTTDIYFPSDYYFNSLG